MKAFENAVDAQVNCTPVSINFHLSAKSRYTLRSFSFARLRSLSHQRYANWKLVIHFFLWLFAGILYIFSKFVPYTNTYVRALTCSLPLAKWLCENTWQRILFKTAFGLISQQNWIVTHENNAPKLLCAHRSKKYILILAKAKAKIYNLCVENTTRMIRQFTMCASDASDASI